MHLKRLALATGVGGALVLTASVLLLTGRPSSAAGTDFSLDLVAASPLTYVHGGANEGSEAAPGSLQYDSRDINTYVRESLEAEDFACGDRAIFFTQVTVASGAVGAQTIEIHYEFDAEPTGQPAVGYSDIVAVGISGPGPVGDFTGQQTQEGGNALLDGNEVVTLVSEGVEPPGSIVGDDAQEVVGDVEVAGLDAGDVVIVRVDVRFSCYPQPRVPTGTLHAVIASAETSLGDRVNVGQQDIPMLGLGGVATLTPPPTATPTSPPPALTPPPTATPVLPVTPTRELEPPTAAPPVTATPPAATQPPSEPPATETPSEPPASFPSSGTGHPAGSSAVGLAWALGILGAAFSVAGVACHLRGRRRLVRPPGRPVLGGGNDARIDPPANGS